MRSEMAARISRARRASCRLRLRRGTRMSLPATEARRRPGIEAALGRISEGTFGICVDCGEPIELQRLEIVPWAARCIEDQTALERERQEHPPRL